jgi:hypothetical protein
MGSPSSPGLHSTAGKRGFAQLETPQPPPQPPPPQVESGPPTDSAAHAGSTADSSLAHSGGLPQAAQDRSKRGRFEHTQNNPSASWRPSKKPPSPWSDTKPTTAQMEALLCDQRFDLLEVLCRHKLRNHSEHRDKKNPASRAVVITKRLETIFENWIPKLGTEIRSAATQAQFPDLFPECMVARMVDGLGLGSLKEIKGFEHAQQAARQYVAIRLGYKPQKTWKISADENNTHYYREHSKTVDRFGSEYPTFAAIERRLSEQPTLFGRHKNLLGQMIDYRPEDAPRPAFGAAWQQFKSRFLHSNGDWKTQEAAEFVKEFIDNFLPNAMTNGKETSHHIKVKRQRECAAVMQAVEEAVLGKVLPEAPAKPAAPAAPAKPAKPASPGLERAEVLALHAASFRTYQFFVLRTSELSQIKTYFKETAAEKTPALDALLLQFIESSDIVFPREPHVAPFQAGQKLQYFWDQLWDADGRPNISAMDRLTGYAHTQHHATASKEPLVSDQEFAHNCYVVLCACAQFLAPGSPAVQSHQQMRQG